MQIIGVAKKFPPIRQSTCNNPINPSCPSSHLRHLAQCVSSVWSDPQAQPGLRTQPMLHNFTNFRRNISHKESKTTTKCLLKSPQQCPDTTTITCISINIDQDNKNNQTKDIKRTNFHNKNGLINLLFWVLPSFSSKDIQCFLKQVYIANTIS